MKGLSKRTYPRDLYGGANPTFLQPTILGEDSGLTDAPHSGKTS